jgi:hypothetical protein
MTTDRRRRRSPYPPRRVFSGTGGARLAALAVGTRPGMIKRLAHNGPVMETAEVAVP